MTQNIDLRLWIIKYPLEQHSNYCQGDRSIAEALRYWWKNLRRSGRRTNKGIDTRSVKSKVLTFPCLSVGHKIKEPVKTDPFQANLRWIITRWWRRLYVSLSVCMYGINQLSVKKKSEGKNQLEEYIEERFSGSSFTTFQESSKMTKVPSILTCTISDPISGQPSQVNA